MNRIIHVTHHLYHIRNLMKMVFEASDFLSDCYEEADLYIANHPYSPNEKKKPQSLADRCTKRIRPTGNHHGSRSPMEN